MFLYEGKAKSVYTVKDYPYLIWMEFKDNLTAFNGEKKSSFAGKGALNRDMSSVVFRFLEKAGVNTHWVADVQSSGMVCERLQILPLEVVVRNRLAGSIVKKFQFSEGRALSHPLVEFYYKNDELNDPFISSEQALAFHFVSSQKEIELLKAQALCVNQELRVFFDSVGLDLIDFKLEFGQLKGVGGESRKKRWDRDRGKRASLFYPHSQGGSQKRKPDGDKEPELNLKGEAPCSATGYSLKQGGLCLLGDEISCDSCRLWDKRTGKKMDKDRFRLNLGEVEESYKKVHDLLMRQWSKKND